MDKDDNTNLLSDALALIDELWFGYGHPKTINMDEVKSRLIAAIKEAKNSRKDSK
jgi:hypothetical protein